MSQVEEAIDGYTRLQVAAAAVGQTPDLLFIVTHMELCAWCMHARTTLVPLCMHVLQTAEHLQNAPSQ